MLKIVNSFPDIKLTEISSDVSDMVANKKLSFAPIGEAPRMVRVLAWLFNETYISYKNIVYIPAGHVTLASSANNTDRVVATSKLLPWTYAVKHNRVNDFKSLFTLLSDVETRSYYFIYEYALLKAHEIPELPELIAFGFIGTRRNKFGFKRNSDKTLGILKEIINTKVEKLPKEA